MWTFISLHTWALLQSSRHSHVVNRTWELTDVPPEYVRYYGVQFDPIKDGDREAAVESLHDFAWAVHNCIEHRKEKKREAN